MNTEEQNPLGMPEVKTMDDVMPKDMPMTGTPDMTDVLPENFPGE